MDVQEQTELLPEVYASWLARLGQELPPDLLVAIKALLSAVQNGHVCIALPPEDRSHWLQTTWVGLPGDYRPFILEDSRFYLARYRDHEERVAASLRERATAISSPNDAQQLKVGLASLFPQDPSDRQRLAALVAQFKPLTLISGGPGTGKTTTVLKLLALLVEQGPRLRIALAAPTGKAAQRLAESIRNAKAGLDLPEELAAAIPENANTLHRLLGVYGDTGRYRHHAGNPLTVDALVVDEASMIDLAMMRAVLDALPLHARLILLGDRNQLASVEAGSVFGDICAASGMSAGFLQQLQPFQVAEAPTADAPLLGDCRVELTRSYRFDSGSGIGALATASREGDAAAFAQAFTEGRADIVWVRDRRLEDAALRQMLLAGIQPFRDAVKTGDVTAAFAAFHRFRILCAHRRGLAGVEGINQLLESALHLRHDGWYAGRPVLISANDYALRLFNGDIGLCLPTAEGLRVFFETSPGEYRALLPGRVPAHETAYAMTVHKSQGSEFDEVVLILPEQPSPVLNRPLVYTAITRAKKRFTLWGKEAVLATALATLPERASGLPEKLR